ncbi:MAG: bi-domain-containing oxidoreductase [Elusimicrobia bacterium]|nr:bi-domain-containing oxidoreductase [Elusimicrobiota bacterium]
MKKLLLQKGKIVVADVPMPGEPAEHELKIRVLSTALSPGTESALVLSGSFDIAKNWHLASKAFRFAKERGITALWKKFEQRWLEGFPMGYSACGVVESCGSKSEGFAPGDLAACSGGQFAGHAEFILASSRLCVKVPQQVGPQEAATVALGAIALQGIRKLDLKIGETAVVLGLGAIGQIAAQMGQAAGLKIIGIDRDLGRLEFAKSRGWLWQAAAPDKTAERQIFDWTEGQGADGALLTLHAPGDAGPFEWAAKLVRRRGKVTILGNLKTDLPREIFYEKDLNVNIAVSYGPGRYDKTYEEQGQDYPLSYVRWTAQRNMACYLDLIAAKKINIAGLIQAVYPITQADQAYENLSRGQGAPILTLLSYDGPASQNEPKLPVKTPKPKPKTSRIGVGVVGAGNFVTSVHLPIIAKLSETFQIRLICNKRPEKASAVAGQYRANATADYKEVLANPDIDLVLIGTRHSLHAAQAAAVLTAGKALFLEKPMATTVEDLERLKEIYSNKPVPFHIGFNRRFSPLIATAKKHLQAMPKPWMIQYRVAAEYIPKEHWVLSAEGGGRIIGELCHMLDLAGYLLRPTNLAASPWMPKNIDVRSLGGKNGDLTENVSVILSYPGDSLAAINYGAAPSKQLGKERLEILTPGGTILLDDFKTLKISIGGQSIVNTARPAPQKGFEEEWLLFGEHLKGRLPQAPISFEEAAAVTELSFLIDQKARNLESPAQ